ncbi:MAG: DDE-type integrase/transposase/recombinase [Candidatus Brocadiia bacterium]
MIKKFTVIIIYIIDYLVGWSSYYAVWLIGKSRKPFFSAKKRIIMFIDPDNASIHLELQHLREELMRLRFANKVMRQELNRVTQKKPCLCKKLEIIYFKLRFDVPLLKVENYLPISRTTVINYLNQLKSGISSLASRIRSYHASPNRTPVSIAHLIWEIHDDNPQWGRWKIALAIQKIGIYVSPSTVRNILNSSRRDYHKPDENFPGKARTIKGQHPNHIWSIDLTTVYVWFKQIYILAIIDHYSRKAVTLVATFNPTASWTIDKVNKTIRAYGKPTHLISDQGKQFIAGNFIGFLKDEGIHHRYANISQDNSNSKVERFFLSLKYEFLNLFLFFSKSRVDKLLDDYLKHYNEYRPHEALDGQVPDEMYFHKVNDKPQKNAKAIKGEIERIVSGEGFLKAYQLKKSA